MLKFGMITAAAIATFALPLYGADKPESTQPAPEVKVAPEKAAETQKAEVRQAGTQPTQSAYGKADERSQAAPKAPRQRVTAAEVDAMNRMYPGG